MTGQETTGSGYKAYTTRMGWHDDIESECIVPECCNLGGVLRVDLQVHSALGHVSLQGRCLDHNLRWVVKFELLEAGQLLTWFPDWFQMMVDLVLLSLWFSSHVASINRTWQWKIPSVFFELFPIEIATLVGEFTSHVQSLVIKHGWLENGP